MKYLIIVLYILLFNFNGVSAQTSHLSFMGIPINGDIAVFQTKIQSKGFKTYSDLNRYLPMGIRAFYGDFGGRMSDIYVYYNPLTKNVYKVRASFDYDNKSYAFNDFLRMQSSLKENHANHQESNNKNDAYDICYLAIPNDDSKNTNEENLKGKIYLFRNSNSFGKYSQHYFIIIDYIDYINFKDYFSTMSKFF